MKFKVYRIAQKEICVPSENYNARSNDYQTETLNVLIFVEEFKTHEEALERVNELIKNNHQVRFMDVWEYTILPVYS
jgi:hypothetical protein